ncbi:zinc finger protein 569 [Folsomia candida]|nr:zinc finger protein 569 [Folsomia candida]
MQIHRVIVQLWRDSRGRVRMITAGVSEIKDLELASINAINKSNGRLKPFKLGGTSSYCSYLDKTKIRLTANPKDCIDIGVYSDSFFSGCETKFYTRDRKQVTCSFMPSTAKQYLKKDVDKINAAIDAKIHNLIEEVDPEDEVEEDLEDVSLVKKKKARVFRKGRKVHICGVCGLRVQDKTEMDRHTRTHTGERPFMCEKCPARPRFAQKSNLTRHQRLGCGNRGGGNQKIGRRKLQIMRMRVENGESSQEVVNAPAPEKTKEELEKEILGLKEEIRDLKTENNFLKKERQQQPPPRVSLSDKTNSKVVTKSVQTKLTFPPKIVAKKEKKTSRKRTVELTGSWSDAEDDFFKTKMPKQLE